MFYVYTSCKKIKYKLIISVIARVASCLFNENDFVMTVAIFKNFHKTCLEIGRVADRIMEKERLFKTKRKLSLGEENTLFIM